MKKEQCSNSIFCIAVVFWAPGDVQPKRNERMLPMQIKSGQI